MGLQIPVFGLLVTSSLGFKAALGGDVCDLRFLPTSWNLKFLTKQVETQREVMNEDVEESTDDAQNGFTISF